MRSYQRINHFPAMIEITRKDNLARNMNRMKKLFPEEYSFIPNTWVLPREFDGIFCFIHLFIIFLSPYL